ncbi:MAG TPA: hypothetical protein VNJ29_03060, partial [Candidatus Nitrosotenuis sp.]|nr:hypothetical protein [Candidatus Nitrosotenuis sp.]
MKLWNQFTHTSRKIFHFCNSVKNRVYTKLRDKAFLQQQWLKLKNGLTWPYIYLRKLVDENKNTRAARNQLRLLSMASLLEEGSLPQQFKMVTLAISMSIFILLLLASIVSLKEVARTSGEIVPSGYIQQIQHLEGGTISEISVQDGQLVDKGALLVKIAGESIRDELKKAEAREITLRLQSERYRAFANLETAEFDRIAKDLSKLAEDQRKILESMKDSREKQKKVIQEQLAQRHELLKQAETKFETLSKNLKLALETKKTKKELFEKGFT